MWVAVLLSACTTPTEAPAPVPAPAAAPAPAEVATPSSADAEVATPARAPRDWPPQIASIGLAPGVVRVADPVRASVKATDPEGARLDLDYEWFINDTPVIDVAGDRLAAGRHAKGDKIRVRVTADDGANEAFFDSEVVTVVNSPPVFDTAGHEMSRVDGFRFNASDPDGDALTWKLEGAPAGMTISSKGVLAYTGTQDEPGGKYTVAVIVDDGEAWGRFQFPLTVSAGSKGTDSKSADPKAADPKAADPKAASR